MFDDDSELYVDAEGVVVELATLLMLSARLDFRGWGRTRVELAEGA